MKELLSLNRYQIIATSIDLTKNIRNFEWYDRVKYIQCDLNESKKNYFTFFEEPDSLIHLSWEGLPNYNEFYHFERNLFSNYNFIKNIIKNGLKDVNIIGTCFEYGMKSGCLSEDIETNPINAYSIAKDTLRRFIELLNDKFNFSFKWIRLFYMYGQGQNPNSLIAQLDKALENDKEIFNMSGGEQIRDYLHISKVAEYIVRISLQKKITGKINCCSGKPISIKELVENYIKKKGKSIKLNLGYYPYPDYVPMAFWGDNSKLNSILKNDMI